MLHYLPATAPTGFQARSSNHLSRKEALLWAYVAELLRNALSYFWWNFESCLMWYGILKTIASQRVEELPPLISLSCYCLFFAGGSTSILPQSADCTSSFKKHQKTLGSNIPKNIQKRIFPQDFKGHGLGHQHPCFTADSDTKSLWLPRRILRSSLNNSAPAWPSSAWCGGHQVCHCWAFQAS